MPAFWRNILPSLSGLSEGCLEVDSLYDSRTIRSWEMASQSYNMRRCNGAMCGPVGKSPFLVHQKGSVGQERMKEKTLQKEGFS
jgi:hypothetical protein